MSTPDLAGSAWRKSTYSQQDGACVEVAGNLQGIVAVRDSKDPAGPALVFSRPEFAGFIRCLAADDLTALS